MNPNIEQPVPVEPVYSGQVIGAIVKALGLSEGVLKERTAERFFDSQPVNEHSRREILTALGAILVERGIVPVPSRLSEQAISMPDIIASTIGLAALRWDHLQATIQGRSTMTAAAIDGFLRLVVIDLAIRVFALLHLADQEPHPPETPLWAQENGGGRLLRELTKRANLTRDHLAARLGTSPTSVDNWLDGHIRPTPENIANLAAVLGRAINISAPQLEQDIQRQFTFAHLADLLVLWISREQVVALSTALVRFIWHIAQNVQRANDTTVEEAGAVELNALVSGAAHPYSHILLLGLVQSEPDSDWRRALLAATVDWSLPFQAAALQAGLPRMAAGLAQDILDVPTEETVAENTSEHVISSDPAQEALKRLLMESDLWYERFAQGDIRSPEEMLETGIARRRAIAREFPVSPNAHFALGSFLGMAGKHLRNRSFINEGIMECHIAAGLLPGWDAPAVEPGIILGNIGAFEEAFDELSRAREHLPEATPHFLINMGYVLMNLSKYAEALTHFEEVLDAKPNFALAYLHAAHCAFSLGDPTRGLRYAKAARRLGESAAYNAWRKGKYTNRSRTQRRSRR